MRPGTYGFTADAGKNFDEALKLVVQELKTEGFGIITDIDFQAIVKEKLNIDEPRYRILGACNPNFAHQALRADPDIGLLLPCNVVVREDHDGYVTIAFTAPEVFMALVNRREVSNLADEIRRRFERVRDAVITKIRQAA
jgi:uncharacterized protein (DUF302 family)